MISSEPIRRHIEVTRTARYYEIGDLDTPVDELWFVLHGYSQTALEFAEPFNAHTAPGRLIVVPEALSRFYRKSTSGSIGASWMTSEDRSAEIRDYIRYLNTLYKNIIEQMDGHVPILNVLGFSQGASTAARWLASGEVRADHLILWCGEFARDLSDSGLPETFASTRITLVTSTADTYVSIERAAEEADRLRTYFEDITHLEFVGGHEIDTQTLDNLMKQAV
jgi:predicted esterase